MDIRGMYGRSAERFSAAWVDWYVRFTYSLQYPSSVARSVLQGCIAMDRGDAQEIQ